MRPLKDGPQHPFEPVVLDEAPRARARRRRTDDVKLDVAVGPGDSRYVVRLEEGEVRARVAKARDQPHERDGRRRAAVVLDEVRRALDDEEGDGPRLEQPARPAQHALLEALSVRLQKEDRSVRRHDGVERHNRHHHLVLRLCGGGGGGATATTGHRDAERRRRALRAAIGCGRLFDAQAHIARGGAHGSAVHLHVPKRVALVPGALLRRGEIVLEDGTVLR